MGIYKTAAEARAAAQAAGFSFKEVSDFVTKNAPSAKGITISQYREEHKKKNNKFEEFQNMSTPKLNEVFAINEAGGKGSYDVSMVQNGKAVENHSVPNSKELIKLLQFLIQSSPGMDFMIKAK